jgi:hypothetical protein
MTTPNNTVTVVLQIASPTGETVFFWTDAREGAATDAPGKHQFASLISVLESALSDAHRHLMPTPNDHDRN